MKPIATIILGAAMLAGSPAISYAGPCDAYFKFDGALADTGGNGYNGQMIAGALSGRPAFTKGKFGEALLLDGTSAMRAPLDLHYEACPQLTMTAWIYVAPNASDQTLHVLSTGGGSGLGLSISGAFLTLAGTDNGIGQQDAVPKGSWFFVAGVYDWPKNTYRLYWSGRRSEPQELSQIRYEPKPSLWIGTVNDEWGEYASGIAIDELRIVGQALNEDQVAMIRMAAPADGGVVVAEGSPAPAGLPLCRAMSDCAAGSYCAIDGTCHPDIHRPMPASAGGTEAIAEMTDRNATEIEVDYESPPDLLNPASAGGTAAITEMTDRNATDIEVDYEQPPDLISGNSSGSGTGSMTDESTATSQPGAQANMSDGLTIGEILRGHVYTRDPTGDVRECTSFAEVVADLATMARDTIVEIATRKGCGLLRVPYAQTGMAATFPGADPRTPKIQDEILKEVYNTCIVGVVGVAEIPDSMLSFWNNTLAAGRWATIGPRELKIEETNSGNLVSPGDRKFITAGPLMGADSVTIGIEELGGRARTHARMCSVSMHNVYTQHELSTFNETPEERQNERQVRIKDIAGVSFHFLIVKLDAEGTPNRHFQYEVKVYKN